MRLALRLAACLFTVAFMGCNSDLPPLASLTGKVTLNGVPFANGSLMFSPTAGGRPSVASTDEKGEFKAYYSVGVAGAIIGKHTVMFEAGGSNEPLSEEEAMNLHRKNPRPPKNHKITPTEIDVQSSGTVVNFTLQ